MKVLLLIFFFHIFLFKTSCIHKNSNRLIWETNDNSGGTTTLTYRCSLLVVNRRGWSLLAFHKEQNTFDQDSILFFNYIDNKFKQLLMTPVGVYNPNNNSSNLIWKFSDTHLNEDLIEYSTTPTYYDDLLYQSLYLIAVMNTTNLKKMNYVSYISNIYTSPDLNASDINTLYQNYTYSYTQQYNFTQYKDCYIPTAMRISDYHFLLNILHGVGLLYIFVIMFFTTVSKRNGISKLFHMRGFKYINIFRCNTIYQLIISNNILFHLF
jgi:hypothetical protein